MDKPSLTCVIPAYNAEAFIGAALDSVAHQTRPCDQVIVVDDRSSDRTVEAVRTWAGRHLLEIRDTDVKNDDNALRQRLKEAAVVLICRTKNQGPAAARNLGVDLAGGEWIAFLDGDDMWLSRKIETQWRYHEAFPHVVLWCGGITHTPPAAAVTSGDRNGDGPPPRKWRGIGLDELAWHNPVATSTVLVRKSAVDAVGRFDPRFRGPEDYELWLRLAAAYPLGLIGEELSYYRVSTDSLSMDDRKFLQQILSVFDKAYGPGGVLEKSRHARKARAWQMLSGAWMANERRAYGDAWGWLLKSLLQWPGPFTGPVCKKWARLKLIKYLVSQMLIRHRNPMKENHGRH